MNNRFLKDVVLTTVCVFTLSACAGAKDKMGLTSSTPDEFKVIRHAPLTLPPNYALHPPEPGAPRPQDQEAVDQAAQSVFGQDSNTAASASDGESALLFHAGGNAADPDIRRMIDEETDLYVDKNRPVAQKLLDLAGGNKGAAASVVDAEAEVERLQSNAQAGKSVTSGETPTVDE